MHESIPTGRYLIKLESEEVLLEVLTRPRNDVLVRRGAVCEYLEPQLNGSVMAFVQPRRSEQLFRWRVCALHSEVTHDRFCSERLR